MATLQELEQAFLAAHAAGDTNSATILANELARLSQGVGSIKGNPPPLSIPGVGVIPGDAQMDINSPQITPQGPTQVPVAGGGMVPLPYNAPPVPLSREQMVMEQTWNESSWRDKLLNDLARGANAYKANTGMGFQGLGANAREFMLNFNPQMGGPGMTMQPAPGTPGYEQYQASQAELDKFYRLPPEEQYRMRTNNPVFQFGARMVAKAQKDYPNNQPDSVSRLTGAFSSATGNTLASLQFLPMAVAMGGAMEYQDAFEQSMEYQREQEEQRKAAYDAQKEAQFQAQIQNPYAPQGQAPEEYVPKQPDPTLAHAQAVEYAGYATAIENVAGAGYLWRQVKKSLGKEAAKAFVREGKQGFNQYLVKTGKELGKGMGAGFGEEFSQQSIEDAITRGQMDWGNSTYAGLLGALGEGPPSAMIHSAGDVAHLANKPFEQKQKLAKLFGILNDSIQNSPYGVPEFSGLTETLMQGDRTGVNTVDPTQTPEQLKARSKNQRDILSALPDVQDQWIAAQTLGPGPRGFFLHAPGGMTWDQRDLAVRNSLGPVGVDLFNQTQDELENVGVGGAVDSSHFPFKTSFDSRTILNKIASSPTSPYSALAKQVLELAKNDPTGLSVPLYVAPLVGNPDQPLAGLYDAKGDRLATSLQNGVGFTDGVLMHEILHGLLVRKMIHEFGMPMRGVKPDHDNYDTYLARKHTDPAFRELINTYRYVYDKMSPHEKNLYEFSDLQEFVNSAWLVPGVQNILNGVPMFGNSKESVMQSLMQNFMQILGVKPKDSTAFESVIKSTSKLMQSPRETYIASARRRWAQESKVMQMNRADLLDNGEFGLPQDMVPSGEGKPKSSMAKALESEMSREQKLDYLRKMRFEAIVRAYMGEKTQKQGGSKKTTMGNLKDWTASDLQQMFQQLKALHEQRTTGEILTGEKGMKALETEDLLWEALREKFYRQSLEHGENLTGMSLAELEKRHKELVEMLNQQIKSGKYNLQSKWQSGFQASVRQLEDLIKKEKAKSQQGLGGPWPLSQPERQGPQAPNEDMGTVKDVLSKMGTIKGWDLATLHALMMASKDAKGLGVRVIAEDATEKGELHGGAYYEPQTDTIHIDRALMHDKRTLMHEMVHGLTSHKLYHEVGIQIGDNRETQAHKLREYLKTGKDQATRNLAAMFLKAKQVNLLSGQYGMQDIYEFVANGMTDPEFRRRLQGTKWENTNRTWYQVLWDFVKSLFGEVPNNMLGSLEKSSKEIMTRERPEMTGNAARVEPADDDAHGVRTEEQPFASSAAKALRDPSFMQGFAKSADEEMEKHKIINKLKKNVNSIEWDILKEKGIEQFSHKTTTINAMIRWVELNSPVVKVTTFKYNSPERTRPRAEEFDRLTHEWYDSLTVVKRDEYLQALQGVNNNQTDMDDSEFLADFLENAGWTQDEVNKALEYRRAENDAHLEDLNISAHDQHLPVWPHLSPKSRDEMRGYTEISVNLPMEPVQYTAQHRPYPNNTVVHVRLYYEMKDGLKIANIVEVQSDWGQKLRKTDDALEEFDKTVKAVRQPTQFDENEWKVTYDDPEHGTRTTHVTASNKEAATLMARHQIEYGWGMENSRHPLLRDYNRLGIKAAIDEAIKQGADDVALLDSETAMMTQGHDTRITHWGIADRDGNVIENRTTRESAIKEIKKHMEEGWQLVGHIQEEGGMRKNYDATYQVVGLDGKPLTKYLFSTGADARAWAGSALGGRLKDGQYNVVHGDLHDILEELTDEKGTPVDFGENHQINPAMRRGTPLVIRNPDGKTLKKNVTARSYSLDKAKEKLNSGKPFTLTGKQWMRTGTSQVPDFLPIDEAVNVYNTRSLIEQIPQLQAMSRIWGTKGRFLDDPAARAIITWYAERYGVARALTNETALAYQGKLNKVFKADSEGNLNVTGRNPDDSLKMSDVFGALRNDPNAYYLSPEQRAVWDNTLHPILDGMANRAEKYEVAHAIEDDLTYRPYFPRYVISRPSGRPKAGTGLNTAGKNLFPSRTFETEKEGWEAGAKYATDVEARLTEGFERLFTMIADKRFSENALLEAKTPTEVRNALEGYYHAHYPSMDPADIDRRVEKRISEGRVPGMLFANKIFTPEVAQMLKDEFKGQAGIGPTAIARANSLLKTLSLGLDFGVGMVQLQLMLFSHPDVWSKAMWNSLDAFLDPDFMARYADANEDVIRRLSILGSPVGELIEHMAGLERAGMLQTALGKLGPVGKPGKMVLNAFARQFNAAMDIAKIEMFKAYQTAGMSNTEAFKLIQTIENTLGFARTESAGLKHHRSIIERVLLLAPTYYRGATELITRLGEGGVDSKVAARALAGFTIAGPLLFIAAALALGVPPDEIKKRLTPGRGEFMMLPIPMPWRKKDGIQWVEVGLGGIYLSLINMVARTYNKTKNKPKDLLSLRSDKNPMSSWIRGHTGPVPRILWDMMTGFDYGGDTTDLRDVPKNALPLAMSGNTTWEEMIPQSFGFKTRAVTRLNEDQMTRKMYGKGDYDELRDLKQRAYVTDAVKKQPRRTSEEEWQASRFVQEQMYEKMAELRNQLPKDEKKYLLEHNLQLRNWQESFEIKREGLKSVPIRLTDEERTLYKTLIKDYYVAGIKYTMEKYPGGASQEQLDKVLTRYREEAKTKFTELMKARTGAR